MKIGFSALPHPVVGSVGTYSHHLCKILAETAPEHHCYAVDEESEAVPDIYHCFGLPRRSDRRCCHAQVVVTVTDLRFLIYPKMYSLLDRLIHFRVYRHFYRAASCLVVMNREAGEELSDRLGIDPQHIEVVMALGVHPPIEYKDEALLETVRGKYALPERYVIVFCVPEPRQELFEIFDALRAADPECTLLVCGRHSAYSDFLLRYARGTGGARRLEFIYEPGVEELPLLLRGACACVSMAESGAEGTLHPLVEAFRSGVPLVLSDTSCHREAAADAALYVPIGAEKQLATAFKHLLRQDDPVRQGCIDRGRLRAAHFSPEAVAQRMLEIYASLPPVSRRRKGRVHG